MLTTSFSTRDSPSSVRFESWRHWYRGVFEMATEAAVAAEFDAANSNWTIGGLTVSEMASPPVAVSRTQSLVRHNPVDHWMITLSSRCVSEVATRRRCFRVPVGTPFLLTLGEEMSIRHDGLEKRMQIFMSRDTFANLGSILDRNVGMSFDGPRGALLADFMRMVRDNVPTLAAEEASRLKGAVQAMFEACLAPSGGRLESAERPLAATLMERVRKTVTHHLRSPSLGTAMLCREAATSRSQLYRLLDEHGGVAQYIQRRRLSESFAMLCDTSHDFSIGRIAIMLCFANASGFSRAFRREFGITPKEVRLAALGGLPPALPPGREAGPPGSFRACLQYF